MSADQFSLPGMDEDQPNCPLDHVTTTRGSANGYSLFFAIFPEQQDTSQLVAAAAKLQSQHGLKGRLQAAERLHISLYSVASFENELPQRVVDAAIRAAESVACSCIPIVWNRAAHYPHGDGFMLLADEATQQAVAYLQKALGLALQRTNVKGARSTGHAHMTLLYDSGAVPLESPLVAPITWTATRFALVISHKGLSHYQWIGEWPLQSASASAT
ncbi:2'-5' RNA ligase family protein [Variovorax sp. HJSM1_2]|uniref:2'-5' RNA ligase family protein n=1 Tax=Variovorax sp. HJSM1_2 TaxID=3366263 RepID=UPI003BE5D04D